MITIGGRAHTLEEIDAVGRQGYPFAEINIDDPDEALSQTDELMKLKDKYGLYYLAHYPNEGNPSDADKLRELFVPKMKRLLEVTHHLGISKGTMHFWMDRRFAQPSLVSAKIKLMSEMVEHAGRNGVQLCLENLTSQYDSFAAVFDAVPELKMTLDIGHAELLSETNTSFGFIEHLSHMIEHVHVHDNMGGTTVKDDLHLPLGEGIVDYPGILAHLKKSGYASTLTLEVKPPDMARTREAVIRHVR